MAATVITPNRLERNVASAITPQRGAADSKYGSLYYVEIVDPSPFLLINVSGSGIKKVLGGTGYAAKPTISGSASNGYFIVETASYLRDGKIVLELATASINVTVIDLELTGISQPYLPDPLDEQMGQLPSDDEEESAEDMGGIGRI